MVSHKFLCCSPDYNVEFFRNFVLVMNALDNRGMYYIPDKLVCIILTEKPSQLMHSKILSCPVYTHTHTHMNTHKQRHALSVILFSSLYFSELINPVFFSPVCVLLFHHLLEH